MSGEESYVPRYPSNVPLAGLDPTSPQHSYGIPPITLGRNNIAPIGATGLAYESMINPLKTSAITNPSNSNDWLEAIREQNKLSAYDPTKNILQNALEGRGNVVGVAGLGLSTYNALSNAFDFTGERAKRDQFLNTQIDLGKQMVANNIKQDNIQTANANARNEAAKKFTPYTPTTTMLS